MINQMIREARAQELGIHPPPEAIACPAHGQVVAMSYVKHCPDELSCGCRYVPDGVPRCVDCGWPIRAMGPHTPAGTYCGDGSHGCLAVGG